MRPLRLHVLRGFLALAFLAPAWACAQTDPTSRSWNQPVEPYRIIGNVYYVGASDLTSYLITTPEGHILLDGGLEESVPIIEAGIRKLGFELADVKILLNGHAHFDHAGGLAELKRRTGATFYASEREAPLLAAGGKGDYALGDTGPYPPVQADRLLRDGDRVTLGGVTLTAHLTPGHTKGNTTWTLQVVEGGKRYDVAVVGSLTVLPGVKLTGMPRYPEIAADFEQSFRVLRSLPCDVFLSAHGSFFDMTEKAAKVQAGGPNPFVDPAGCRAYVERKERDFREQLAATAAPRSRSGAR